MGEAAVLDIGELPTVDDACSHACPFLVGDAASEDRNHAVGSVGGEDRDLWVLRFQDRGQDAGTAAIIESVAVGGGEWEDARDALQECFAGLDGKTLNLLIARS